MPAPHVGSIPPMRTPMTYVIDYSRAFLDDESAIREFAEAPPDLMHVGKSVPILHNWGPVHCIHGENQATAARRRPGEKKRGLDRDAICLLTPEELEARIERLKDYTRRWHDLGVPLLMPYSSYHTIAGDHETREGFWAFYDRWDDYARWLGPRPGADPIEWSMRDRQGGIVPGACGGFSPPYYAPLHRYRCCPENPHWRRFQGRLTELIAEVGYDGVFPDNSSIHSVCFCEHCRRGFREFVSRCDPRELAVLGLEGAPEDLDLRDESLPAELVRRYRIDTCSRWQEWIRASGRRVNPDFKVFPNINSFEVFMPISAHCDFLMFESTHTPGYPLRTPPPEGRYAAVEVVEADPDATPREIFISESNREARVAYSASVRFPRQARLGEAATLSVEVEKVGFWFEDAYRWADGFALIITEEAGREERVPLAPPCPIAARSPDPDAQTPPVTLRAGWRPHATGRHRLALEHRHHLEELETDDERPVRMSRTVRNALDYGGLHHTHIGHFLFTMHAGARTISLDYALRRAGTEPLQELALAEAAAFSNGSTTAVRGEPLRKYARFFRRSRHLYEGFVPFADIGLLYAYWGFNPETLSAGYTKQQVTPSVALSQAQRLIKVLMDRTLVEADLAPLRSLILCGHRLEMADEQIEAVRRFAGTGGGLFVYREDTTINARPVAEVFPRTIAWQPDVEVAGAPALIEAAGYERGLRFSAFVHAAEPRMTLHAVNFNVCFRDSPARVIPVGPVSVALPLPEGARVASVRCHDPDAAEVQALPFEETEGALRIALPEVRIYNVLEIASADDGARQA